MAADSNDLYRSNATAHRLIDTIGGAIQVAIVQGINYPDLFGALLAMTASTAVNEKIQSPEQLALAEEMLTGQLREYMRDRAVARGIIRD